MEKTKIKEFIDKVDTYEHLYQFKVFFHGGVLAKPAETTDIDVKVVNSQAISIKRLEEFMVFIKKAGAQPVFMRTIDDYAPIHKPLMTEIDRYDPPRLQAVLDYHMDIEELKLFNKGMNPKYIFRGSPGSYHKIGRLTFCYSGEWAIMYHKYNEAYNDMEDETQAALMKDRAMGVAYHNAGLLDTSSRVKNYGNIEIGKYSRSLFR